MKFESKFGLGEIVIRETHKNGEMVQERMMEVIAVNFSYDAVSYLCEATVDGIRQWYGECMLVGDPDFDQETGKYPIGPNETGDTNAKEHIE